MKCFSAAATVVLAAMLCGCQQKADMTPVWQIDLPTTGVHCRAETWMTIFIR